MAVVTKKRLFLLSLAAVGAWYARTRSAPAPTPVPAPAATGVAAPTELGSDAAPLVDEPALDVQADEVLASETPGPVAEAPTEPEPTPAIKGSAESTLFHTPDSPYYEQTVADQWFATEDDARAAGFTRWNDRAFPAPVEVREGAYGPGSAAPLEGGGSPSPS